MSIFLTNRILSLIIKTLALINIRACGILCVTRPKKFESPHDKAQQTSRLCELRDVEPFALKGPNVDHDHRRVVRREAHETGGPQYARSRTGEMANLTAAREWQPWPNQVADEKGIFADLAGEQGFFIAPDQLLGQLATSLLVDDVFGVPIRPIHIVPALNQAKQD